MGSTFDMDYRALVSGATTDFLLTYELGSDLPIVRPLVMPDRRQADFAALYTPDKYEDDLDYGRDSYVFADVVIVDGNYTEWVDGKLSVIHAQFLLVTEDLCDCSKRSILSAMRTMCAACTPSNPYELSEAALTLLTSCTDMNQL